MPPIRMLLSGLTSDTFQELQPRKIVDLCQAAKLDGVEWDESPHVPVGNISAATEARAATESAGLVVISYGSDRPVGADESLDLEELVATATALGAGAVRVRVGSNDDDRSTSEQWKTATTALSNCVRLAEQQGLLVAIGLRNDSLARTGGEAKRLMEGAEAETAHVFWSPVAGGEISPNVADLDAVRDSVLGVHCSGVDVENGLTMLSEATDRWARYLSVLAEVDDDHWLCLRGVENCSTDNFYRDAQTLRRFASRYGGE